jgi:hypothetical protein
MTTFTQFNYGPEFAPSAWVRYASASNGQVVVIHHLDSPDEFAYEVQTHTSAYNPDTDYSDTIKKSVIVTDNLEEATAAALALV